MLTVDSANSASLLSEKEQQCVNALVMFYGSKDLKAKVRKIMGKGATPSSVFKVFSEIKRLSQQCNRRIDLRDAGKGIEMKEFEFQGMLHAMDQSSIDVFNKLSKEYNERYTFGVYEGVIQYFKKNKLNIKETQISADVDLNTLSFSQFYARKDERMNLAVGVSFFMFKDIMTLKQNMSLNLRKEAKYAHQEVSGNTVNISRSGLKIKTHSPIQNDYVLMRFDGLEKDFIFEQKYIAYEVVKNEVIDDETTFVFLCQIDSPTHDVFNNFIDKMIYANKRRYKVVIDNTIESVENRAYEQYFISRYKGLFLSLDDAMSPMFTGYSDPALPLIDYFSVESKFILPCLLKKDDLYKKSLSGPIYLLVYKKKGGIFSVPLADANALSFFQYVSQFDTAKLFKLETRAVDIHRAMANTSTLPEHIQKKAGLPTIFKIAPRLQPKLAKIKYSLEIEELSLHNLSDWLKGREEIGLNKEVVRSYNASLLSRARNSNDMLVKMESNDFRSEDRFFCSLGVTITTEKSTLAGETVDISVKGLSIKITGSLPLAKGDKVKVSFEQLSDSYVKFDRENIEYRVVGCDNGLLRVRAPNSPSHDGRRLMSRVIYDNINTLRSHRQQEGQYGLARVMRNVLAQNHMSIASFYTMKSARPFTTKVALSTSHGNTASYLSQDLFSCQNIRFGKEFFYHQQVTRAITLLLGSVSQDNQYDYAIVAVAKGSTVSSYKMGACRVWLAKEFSLDKAVAFKRLCKDKDVSFYHMSLTRKSRVFDKYYRDELRYISAYAMHKSESLEKEIGRVTGLCQFNDITTLIDKIS